MEVSTVTNTLNEDSFTLGLLFIVISYNLLVVPY